jgi:hypothetical protein
MRSSIINLAWISLILAAVILIAQTALLAFESIQHLVTRALQQTQSQVAKGWRMWVVDEYGGAGTLVPLYCMFLLATSLCGK